MGGIICRGDSSVFNIYLAGRALPLVIGQKSTPAPAKLFPGAILCNHLIFMGKYNTLWGSILLKVTTLNKNWLKCEPDILNY